MEKHQWKTSDTTSHEKCLISKSGKQIEARTQNWVVMPNSGGVGGRTE